MEELPSDFVPMLWGQVSDVLMASSSVHRHAVCHRSNSFLWNPLPSHTVRSILLTTLLCMSMKLIFSLVPWFEIPFLVLRSPQITIDSIGCAVLYEHENNVFIGFVRLNSSVSAALSINRIDYLFCVSWAMKQYFLWFPCQFELFVLYFPGIDKSDGRIYGIRMSWPYVLFWQGCGIWWTISDPENLCLIFECVCFVLNMYFEANFVDFEDFVCVCVWPLCGIARRWIDVCLHAALMDS